MTQRLIEWEALQLRVRGEKVQAIARDVIRGLDSPLEEISLEFAAGTIRVSGKIRKTIAIPFQFVVRRVYVSGRTITVPLEQMSAFGFLPLPSLLTRMVGNRRAADGILFDAVTSSVVIRLDRFLPPFLEVEVAEIRLIEGGLAVRLGPGGSDLPTTSGGDPWNMEAT